MADIKLYVGAGKERLEGWQHLDIHPFDGIDIVADITKGIPLPDNSVSFVFTKDTLEHIPQESKVFVIDEFYRILTDGGFMEHWIPNAGSQNDFGSPTHISHWNLQQFEHFDIDSYRYEKDHGYEGITSKFRKVYAELVNHMIEADGVARYQAIHVRYAAVK